MKQYKIDFSGVKAYWYFYEALIKGLEFPDWCGKNPDAIWDLLTGYAEYPAIIQVMGAKTLPKDLQDEYELILETFEDILEYYDDGRFSIKFME